MIWGISSRQRKGSDLNLVISKLKEDSSFIRDFLKDPLGALDGFSLKADERRALVSRDVNKLVQMQLSGGFKTEDGGRSTLLSCLNLSACV